ncbi:MAG: hypothetical protein QNJ77_08915, partial [Acidimicrobiia bacterium]|nr:hypothetical protein [Acidimicrobiia bacterium]
DELKGVRQDVGTSMTSLSDDVVQAKKELEDQLAETNEEVKEILSESATTPPQSTESGESHGESPEDGANEDGDRS